MLVGEIEQNEEIFFISSKMKKNVNMSVLQVLTP